MLGVKNVSNDIKISNLDRLYVLRSIYGGSVQCKNGLFYMNDKYGNQVFINNETAEIDRRAKYEIVNVYDKIVVASVKLDATVKSVILNKKDLEVLYRSMTPMDYVDKNLCFDISGVIFSHSFSKLELGDNIRSIVNITKNYYLVTCKSAYNDRIIWYNKHSDKFVDITKNKRYKITLLDNDCNLEVIDMNGGRYRYNFIKHDCYNEYTDEIDDTTQLWELV